MAVDDIATQPPTANARRDRRRWLRFSLRALLLLVVAAAVASATWALRQRDRAIASLRWQLATIETENARLKAEIGELVIAPGTENQLQAIGIGTIEPMTWKWRVYVPEGRRFSLEHMEGEIANDTKMENGSSVSFNAGEHVLTIALRKSEFSSEWEWILDGGRGNSMRWTVQGKDAEWIGTPSNFTLETDATVGSQIVMPIGRPLKILRFMRFPIDFRGPMTGPAPGVLVWISDSAGRTNP